VAAVRGQGRGKQFFRRWILVTPAFRYYYYRIIISSNYGPNHKGTKAQRTRKEIRGSSPGIAILAGLWAEAPGCRSTVAARQAGLRSWLAARGSGNPGQAALSLGLDCLTSYKENITAYSQADSSCSATM